MVPVGSTSILGSVTTDQAGGAMAGGTTRTVLDHCRPQKACRTPTTDGARRSTTSSVVGMSPTWVPC